ncbi:hypothetical protein C8J57DRAFT_1470477 [Mycena rebaudengoi]|nr:hypothetical protein C8J57DRAFT_1470477 [Mycena rebaudengoi]
MTEYDYSPEARTQYMQTQSRIQNWASQTAGSQPYHPDTPPTPAPLAPKPLYGGMARNRSRVPSNPVYPPEVAYGPYTNNTLPRSYYPSATTAMQALPQQPPSRPRTAPPPKGSIYGQTVAVPVRYGHSVVPAPPVTTTHFYASQTSTPYGSQYSLTKQTSDGVYVQQQVYQQTTQPLAPQRGPPVNKYPLTSPPVQRRIRSRASTIHAPVAPLQSSNRVYGAGHRDYIGSVQSLAQLHPEPTAESDQTLSRETRRSKSSTTLKSKYSTCPRIEDMPLPPSQHYYTLPRGSKSTTTLESGSKGAKSSRRHQDVPTKGKFGDFGHRTPAASEMLVHSLIPLAIYQPVPECPVKAKSKPLLQRMLKSVTGKKRG